eukprot:CAMPEP_0180639474 /NCGR_PEP_ID=MMETSP1037_2-20121125/45028_1 /TAXON_ID=632150 /ORGANISM="Azadinium spinosum, Strain 3D9" /LENGTH=92 /DNA_ID=CAMNT_0022661373 /DNA_START=406 /DNA_END=684 /DNA_ORIENTATION=-
MEKHRVQIIRLQPLQGPEDDSLRDLCAEVLGRNLCLQEHALPGHCTLHERLPNLMFLIPAFVRLSSVEVTVSQLQRRYHMAPPHTSGTTHAY